MTSTTLKKKCDDLNATLSYVPSRLRQETSHHVGEVKKFKSLIGRLKEDLAHVQRDIKVTKKIAVAEYREFEAIKDDVADGSAESSKIVFSSLFDRLAHDHLTMDLSSYTLARILGMPILQDIGSCPPTPGQLVGHSLKALPIIFEDQPFEAAKAEAEGEMDAFVEELNEVLPFHGEVHEKGKITT